VPQMAMPDFGSGSGTGRWNFPKHCNANCGDLDSQDGELITFHALHLTDGAAFVFVNSLTWPNGWPEIQP
jgi:hypothetical protein